MSEENSRRPHHLEDLSVLSRRGALSAAEQRAFADALGASATLAAAHQLGLDFDQIAVVRPGDDTLIAQVATRSVSRSSSRAGGGWRLRGLLLVAALALASSAVAWWQRGRSTTAVGSPTVTLAGPSAVHALSLPIATATQAPPTAETGARAANSSTPAAPVTSSASTPRTTSTRVDEPGARTFDSAETLFREANAARRTGDNAVARALYLRLERDFPASDEAHLAHVSLGNLLLTMGRAAEAEQQFASYLGGRPALAQEALVGRAQSLAALGQSGEEQRVWQALLRDYPSSVYAGRAKLRLAELARSATHSN